MLSSALGLYNFKAGSTTSGGSILVDPIDSTSGIICLTFSIVLVTENNNFVELITLSKTNINPGAEPILYANSSKFDFSSSDEDDGPLTFFFYQWVTGKGGYSNSYVNYWTYLSLYTHALSSFRSYELELDFRWVGSRIYMTSVKGAILIVSRTINNSAIASYQTYSTDGSSQTKYFKNNLGVNTQTFGQPSEGKLCISGLQTIDLYFYNTSYSPTRSGSTSFLFAYNGNEISGLNYNYVYRCKITTLCVGQCYPGQTFNPTSSSCECSVKYYYNIANSSCLPCPFDCWTC